MDKANTQQMEFMAAYDINLDDGSATLNWLKAALLPEWRETFKKFEKNSRNYHMGATINPDQPILRK